MKAILLLLFVSSSLQYQESEIASRWKLYKMKYDLSFGPQEDSWRKEIWMKNFEEILEHNKDPNELTWQEGPFEHMEESERQSLLKPLDRQDLKKPLVFETPEQNNSVSDIYLDWLDYLVPAEDQGTKCGSCYAFTGKALLEALYNRAHNYSTPATRVRLSTQAIVSCSTNAKCNGGTFRPTLNYLYRPGLPYESAYPYIAKNGTCRNFTTIAQIRTYRELSGNQKVFTEEVKTSPIYVGLLWDKSLDRYDGKTVYGYDGKFPCDKGGITTHTLLLVGYGIQNNRSYWYLRNSHGTGYGDKGYLKFAMTPKNTCGLYDDGFVATV